MTLNAPAVSVVNTAQVDYAQNLTSSIVQPQETSSPALLDRIRQRDSMVFDYSQFGQQGDAVEGEPEDSASRTLRLALSDTSRQIQAKYENGMASESSEASSKKSMGAQARKAVMLQNLESMVNMQLAQFTGNEPYSKANYRQILGTLNNMQGGSEGNIVSDKSSAVANPERSSVTESSWGGKGAMDGAYRLYSGVAAKTLSFFSPAIDPNATSSDKSLSFVA